MKRTSGNDISLVIHALKNFAKLLPPGPLSSRPAIRGKNISVKVPPNRLNQLGAAPS